MKRVAEEIRANREAVMSRMLEATADDRPVAEQRQFLAGFVDLVVAAAEGNLRPRDEYLEAVIPGTKAAGLPLSYIMSVNVSVSMALGASVSPESFLWCTRFCTEYTAALVELWTHL